MFRSTSVRQEIERFSAVYKRPGGSMVDSRGWEGAREAEPAPNAEVARH